MYWMKFYSRKSAYILHEPGRSWTVERNRDDILCFLFVFSCTYGVNGWEGGGPEGRGLFFFLYMREIAWEDLRAIFCFLIQTPCLAYLSTATTTYLAQSYLPGCRTSGVYGQSWWGLIESSSLVLLILGIYVVIYFYAVTSIPPEN